jgi:hypothetical protein
MLKKQETIMVESLEDKIIGLYSLGTSLRDISGHIKESYDTDISATTLSSITDKTSVGTMVSLLKSIKCWGLPSVTIICSDRYLS